MFKGLLEYALLVTLIALVAFASVHKVGDTVSETFVKIASIVPQGARQVVQK